jgi:hypothetical protein
MTQTPEHVASRTAPRNDYIPAFLRTLLGGSVFAQPREPVMLRSLNQIGQIAGRSQIPIGLRRSTETSLDYESSTDLATCLSSTALGSVCFSTK